MVITSSASQPWKSCICSVPQLQQWNPQEKSDIIVVAFGSAPGVPNWWVLSSPLNIVPLLLVDKILEMCRLNPTSCLWCECKSRSKMTSRGLLQQPVVCCHHHRILCWSVTLWPSHWNINQILGKSVHLVNCPSLDCGLAYSHVHQWPGEEFYEKPRWRLEHKGRSLCLIPFMLWTASAHGTHMRIAGNWTEAMQKRSVSKQGPNNQD